MFPFISVVIILCVSVSRTTGNIKQVALKDQLALSLSHVSEIMNSIEDKIDQERKILSQIEYDLNHQQRVGIHDYDTTDIWWDTSNTTKGSPTTPTEILTTLILFPKQSTLPTIPESWHFPTTATDSPFVQDLKKTMALDHHGYFTAFLTRFMELIYTKDTSESYPVLQQLNAVAKKYLDDGKLNRMGDVFTDMLKIVVTDIFPHVPPRRLTQQAGVSHFALKDKKRVPKEVTNFLDFYETLFTKENREPLFTSLEPFYDFPNGNITAPEVSQRIFEAVISPCIKIENIRQKRRLVELLHLTLQDLIPHYRGAPDDEMSLDISNNIMKDYNQSTVPLRRRANNNKRVLFLSKHPKLLKITRHYPHKRKHHHKYRINRGEHRRHLYDREYTRLNLVRNNEQDEKVEGDSSEGSTYNYIGNFKANLQNTHTRQRMKKNRKRLGKLKQQQHRQKQKTKQRQRRLYNGIRRNTKIRQNNFERFKIPSTLEEYSSQSFQDSIENDPLHKIKVSSYSDDEEIHLKNNLFDALRHGNRSRVSFRKVGGDVIDKQILRDLSSETDEEWVLKNNIYKVFEQV